MPQALKLLLPILL